MKHTYSAALASTFIALASPLAYGADAPVKMEQGDIIHTDVNLFWAPHNTPDKASGPEVCFVAGTGFDIISSGSDVTLGTRRRRVKDIGRSDYKDCAKQSIPAPDEDTNIYSISTAGLKKEYYRHFGITHGALFVPFKRRSDKTLSGETNLGYYLGYRVEGPFAVTITPAVSAGLSLVNLTDDSAITGTTTRGTAGTRAAFTWTLGFILTHLDAFQIGVFMGRDRLGGEAGKDWKYENTKWTSVAFGYSFSR